MATASQAGREETEQGLGLKRLGPVYWLGPARGEKMGSNRMVRRVLDEAVVGERPERGSETSTPACPTQVPIMLFDASSFLALRFEAPHYINVNYDLEKELFALTSGVTTLISRACGFLCRSCALYQLRGFERVRNSLQVGLSAEGQGFLKSVLVLLA